jgi:uncharacterized protein YbjT (DUF2867 family)
MDSPIAVAGATGALGRRIVASLLSRGAAVRALVRDPAAGAVPALAGAELAAADVTAPAGLSGALAGARCVVSTVTCFPRPGAEHLLGEVDRDGNLALADAAAAAGVERFVFVSFKPVPLDFPLQRAKRAVEERLVRGDLEAVVLRPGKLMDIWFSPLCGFDVPNARATIFGDGSRGVTWIAAQDVAEIAARSALGEGPRAGTLELGGPEALSQRDAVRVYEQVTGRRWQLDSIPAPELEQRLAAPRDDFDASLAAVMLEAHIGATSPMDQVLRMFPHRPTTVAEYAEAACASPPPA